jgi:hypothetical protein
VVKTLSSHVKRFPKILFALSECRIPKAKSSGDLLPIHRCKPALGMEKATVAAQQREEAKTLGFGVFWWRPMGYI